MLALFPKVLKTARKALKTSRVATRLLGHSRGDSAVPERSSCCGWAGVWPPAVPVQRHAYLAGVVFASQLLGQRPSLYIAAYSSSL